MIISGDPLADAGGRLGRSGEPEDVLGRASPADRRVVLARPRSGGPPQLPAGRWRNRSPFARGVPGRGVARQASIKAPRILVAEIDDRAWICARAEQGTMDLAAQVVSTYELLIAVNRANAHRFERTVTRRRSRRRPSVLSGPCPFRDLLARGL